jgi:hypothetical protein
MARIIQALVPKPSPPPLLALDDPETLVSVIVVVAVSP